MSLAKQSFFGLTLRDVKASLGLGNQTSQLDINLVQDFALGDRPNPVPIGWPAYFELGALQWWGLLQKFTQTNSTEGLPTFQATLLDPRQILDGAVLVLNDWSGGIGPVYNLLNVYGYYEFQGFGRAQVNGGGMLWSRIITALKQMTSGAKGVFGGPLNYRGINYGLDLSELPVPPPFYRVGDTSISLLALIQTICEDSACEFFVELRGYVIHVRVVNRRWQPPLGTISRFIDNISLAGGSPSGEFGAEAVNDITSAVVLGGHKTSIVTTSAGLSFWGYDINGVPITGRPFQHKDIGPSEQMDLNAAGISDIVKSVSYNTNIVELRCALYSLEAWALYVNTYKPAISKLIVNLFGPNPVIEKPEAATDIIKDGRDNMLVLLNNQKQSDTSRLHMFLRTFAEDYYGKQFLVQMPFIMNHLDGETLQTYFNYEPTDSGYLADGAASLGLSPQNQDVIQDENDRVYCFTYWNDIRGSDTNRVNWSDTVIENNHMYSKASVDPKVIWLSADFPIPCVRVTMGTALYDERIDEYGSGVNNPNPSIVLNRAPSIGILIGGVGFAKTSLDTGILPRINSHPSFGTVAGDCGIDPAARYPDTFGVPLKSNVDSYGPWYAAGAPGKVKFEIDQSLTPWEYGGYAAMNAAGKAKVLGALQELQIQETGSVKFVGAPLHSLGDTAVAGGPNITNIDVQYGTSGVTCNYRFSTHTPKFGLFSKQNADRLRRQALAGQEIKRSLRQLLNQQIVGVATVAAIYSGQTANRPKYMLKQSPHTVMMGQAFADGSGIRVGVGSETYEAALYLSNPLDSGNFFSKGAASLTSLFRPFSTQYRPSSIVMPTSNFLPTYNYMDGFAAWFYAATGVGVQDAYNNQDYYKIVGNIDTLSAFNLNPFASGHDIEIGAFGSSYTGMNMLRRQYDPNNIRGLAFKGPMVLTAWGYGVDGNVYPNNGVDDSTQNPIWSYQSDYARMRGPAFGTTGAMKRDGYDAAYYEQPLTGIKTWLDNTLQRSDTWKTGPVDLLWDEYRGVWTSHDLMTGLVANSGGISGGSIQSLNYNAYYCSGLIYIGGNSNRPLHVYNVFGTPIASGATVIVGYMVNHNKWVVTAADCAG